MICSTAAHLDRQRPRSFITCKRQIALTNSDTKLNPVARSVNCRVPDRIDTVAQVEEICVVAIAALQQIIAASTHK